jgi:hypothetical protein
MNGFECYGWVSLPGAEACQLPLMSKPFVRFRVNVVLSRSYLVFVRSYLVHK